MITTLRRLEIPSEVCPIDGRSFVLFPKDVPKIPIKVISIVGAAH